MSNIKKNFDNTEMFASVSTCLEYIAELFPFEALEKFVYDFVDAYQSMYWFLT